MSKDNNKDAKKYEGMRAMSQAFSKPGITAPLILSNKGFARLDFKDLENHFAMEIGTESKFGIIQQILRDQNCQVLKKDPKFFNNFEDDFDDDDI